MKQAIRLYLVARLPICGLREGGWASLRREEPVASNWCPFTLVPPPTTPPPFTIYHNTPRPSEHTVLSHPSFQQLSSQMTFSLIQSSNYPFPHLCEQTAVSSTKFWTMQSDFNFYLEILRGCIMHLWQQYPHVVFLRMPSSHACVQTPPCQVPSDPSRQLLSNGREVFVCLKNVTELVRIIQTFHLNYA